MKKTNEKKPESVVYYRKADILSPVSEDEGRTVSLAFSSEEPYERFFGFEILDHSEKSIDLKFLNSGSAPLLLDHDPEKQIGVIESVELDQAERKSRAVVRFGKNGLAKDIFEDVKDGIRKNISVGYRVNHMTLVEKGGKDKPDTYRVDDWTPMEISVVSIPADTTVGIGRNLDIEIEQPLQDEKQAEDEQVKNEEIKMPEKIEVTADQIRAEIQKNNKEILELAAKHNQRELAEKAISEGKSIEQFRGILLERIGMDKPLETPKDKIGMSEKEAKQFSFVRAVNALVKKDWKGAEFELECSDEVAKRMGRNPQGFFVPDEVRTAKIQKRDLLVGTDTAGGYTVDTELRGFIELLRNSMMVEAMGATTLSGLVGDIAIPKQSGASTAYWVNEGGAITESAQTLAQVTMQPKTVGAFTDISRKLLIQSSLDIEAFVRQDLATVLAIAIDLAAINGSGASSQPLGVLNTTGIGSVTWATSSTPTFGEIVNLESEVANDNALMGSLGYLTTTALRGTLKQTEKTSTSTAQFIWESNNTMNGYRAAVSNQVPAATAIFGNWRDLMVGYWSGLDVLVDPYTGGTTGTVRIRVMQDVDCAVRHAESFSKGSN